MNTHYAQHLSPRDIGQYVRVRSSDDPGVEVAGVLTRLVTTGPTPGEPRIEITVGRSTTLCLAPNDQVQKWDPSDPHIAW